MNSGSKVVDSNFKVSIYQEPCFGGLSVVFWEKGLDGKTYMIAPMQVKRVEVKDGCSIEPSIRLSPDMAPAFMQAMAEALDTHGIKTDSDAHIAGTLEATKEHLKDLQKLVFKTRN